MDYTLIRKTVPASFSRTDTATYTLDDIRKEVNEICLWLDNIWGYEKKMQEVQFLIVWNEKPHSNAIGTCYKNSEYNYKLIFSHRYFEVMLPQGVHTTILHEVLHATKNGFKHTGEWKAKAQYTSCYAGFKVARYVPPEYFPSQNDFSVLNGLKGIKYQIYCPSCKRVIAQRSRNCKITRHPEKFCCGACGDKNLQIKTLF